MHVQDGVDNVEARYRLLVDSITDYAIYMLDPHGHVVSWNGGAMRFKGYSEAEILGQHFSAFYLPADRANGLPQSILDAASQDGRFEGEGWRLRKDGSQFWAHVVVDPIKSPEGDIIGFAKITRDLSERKASHELLRKSEQQFQLLVQGVTDYAIYMLDENGHVSSWNAGAQRIKGYLPDDVIGTHFSRFFEDADREVGVPARALDLAKKEGRFESEGWRVRKDGTRFWANAVIDAIRDDSGKLIGFAKITRDITEKREAQRQLDLAREELFQAQKMEAIGQLTGGVAHDFNNLLMAIQSSLELLGRRLPYTPETEKLIKNALYATQRGASLTQQMLAFSRKQHLELQSVDLREIVSSTADLLQRSLGSSVYLDVQMPSELPRVVTDPHQLANAIMNLAINARDAMVHGGTVFVTAEVKPRPSLAAGLKDDVYVCLSVRDEGEGMDADTLANATTPFFTTKGVGKGTGLGLAMVEGLMAQSHGLFSLHSQQGIGTEAVLWLPISPDDTITGKATMAATLAAAPSPGIRIVAVDDDPLVLMNTVMMLEDMGHSVREANSAAQALEILEQEDFDLLITDHAMPRMTGAQLLEVVRERWPSLPVVLATGYAEVPTGHRADVKYLPKPFPEQQVAALLAELTRQQDDNRQDGSAERENKRDQIV